MMHGRLPVLLIGLLLCGCGGERDPVVEMQRSLASAPAYMIVLDDMREEGSFFTKYYHRYLITQGDKKVQTDWIEVSESIYKKYEPFLGMALVAKSETYMIVLDDMREEGSVFTKYYHRYLITQGDKKVQADWIEVSESIYKKYEPFLGMALVARSEAYMIVLDDMREEGSVFTKYYHRYLITQGDKKVQADWIEVSESIYKKYEPFLGSEKDGVNNTPHPPGYHYVGNPGYGRWVDRGGTSFWEFYGQYALMRDLLGWGGGFGMNRYDYDDYRSHRRDRRPYYGRNREYGTQGSVTQKQKPSTFERRKQAVAQKRQSFAQKVQSRTSQSRSGFGSSRSTSRSSFGSSSRSTTRSRSGFGSRSSGGFGK